MIETVAVIPAYNEESTVASVVQAAHRAEAIDAVIVVDDGSRDGTVATVNSAVETISAVDKPCIITSHPANQGKTEALHSGVALARMLGGSALKTLVFLDADSSPIWSRDSRENMKLWQLALTKLPSHAMPIEPTILQARSSVFIGLLAQYINEIAAPVQTGEEAMRIGMYERNIVTDTLLSLVGWGGHGGNRALRLAIWEGMFSEAKRRDVSVRGWEIEGALNSYAQSREFAVGTFVMRGVVNVGSRVKTGSMRHGLERMGSIHKQALSGAMKLR